jgi:hypothetical protein
LWVLAGRSAERHASCDAFDLEQRAKQAVDDRVGFDAVLLGQLGDVRVTGAVELGLDRCRASGCVGGFVESEQKRVGFGGELGK